MIYFNSRPHEEVDYPENKGVWAILHFNSRPHEEVDITAGVNLIFQLAFQLTTSRRGRLYFFYNNTTQKIFQLTTSRRGRLQFLRKKFSFLNHFLCLLHIIYSYYINTIFFSTLFLQNLHFFWCESPRIFLFTYLSHSAFCSLFILILLIIEPLSTNFKNLRHCPYLLQNHLLELIA